MYTSGLLKMQLLDRASILHCSVGRSLSSGDRDTSSCVWGPIFVPRPIPVSNHEAGLPYSIVKLEDEAEGGSLKDLPADQRSDGVLRMRVLELEVLRDPPARHECRHPENQ